jgi:hypothetical protein
MILDKELVFSDSQAKGTGVFDSAAAFDSTNIVDLTKAGNRLDNLNFVAQVDTAFVGTSSTLKVALATCATTNGSFETLLASDAIPEATLVAGYEVIKTRVPRSGVKRYVKVIYTVGTAAMSAGAISAFLTPELDTNTANVLP